MTANETACEGVHAVAVPFRDLKVALAQSSPNGANVAVVLGKLGFHPPSTAGILRSVFRPRRSPSAYRANIGRRYSPSKMEIPGTLL
jgi:hypothetical protein